MRAECGTEISVSERNCESPRWESINGRDIFAVAIDLNVVRARFTSYSLLEQLLHVRCLSLGRLRKMFNPNWYHVARYFWNAVQVYFLTNALNLLLLISPLRRRLSFQQMFTVGTVRVVKTFYVLYDSYEIRSWTMLLLCYHEVWGFSTYCKGKILTLCSFRC